MQVTNEAIRKAREMDLLTYLQNYEPQELIRESHHVYTTKSHDSLKISNGKWCWWSRNIGGRSALDYLITVRGMKLPEAVIQIEGQAAVRPPVFHSPELEIKTDRLLLPPRNDSNYAVISYLKGRGIHQDIIDHLIKIGRLYEERRFHNAVFVGFDTSGQPQYAMLRGTMGKRFFLEAPGSNKRYSFSLPSKNGSDELHVFEGAIDLISYATIELNARRNPYSDNLISLGGIYTFKDNAGDVKSPLALEQFLHDHPEIGTIRLHLDNDTAGRNCTCELLSILSREYTVTDEPPPSGKDYNDYLCKMIGPSGTKSKEVYER